MGQLTVSYGSQRGGYVARHPDGTGFALPGAQTRQEALAQVRAMVNRGGIRARDLYPLPDSSAVTQPLGAIRLPGLGDLRVAQDRRTGSLRVSAVGLRPSDRLGRRIPAEQTCHGSCHAGQREGLQSSIGRIGSRPGLSECASSARASGRSQDKAKVRKPRREFVVPEISFRPQATTYGPGS